jgi:hypothetical protein
VCCAGSQHTWCVVAAERGTVSALSVTYAADEVTPCPHQVNLPNTQPSVQVHRSNAGVMAATAAHGTNLHTAASGSAHRCAVTYGPGLLSVQHVFLPVKNG